MTSDLCILLKSQLNVVYVSSKKKTANNFNKTDIEQNYSNNITHTVIGNSSR